jgi:hypothetical protein
VPRFVVLAHDWPTPHFDFLLEAGGVLRAWRLMAEPFAGAEIPAEPNVDHRLLYLDYEGPVSGDRGTVRRWDAGTFEWLVEEPDRVAIDLRGEKVSARAEWTRDEARWVFRV